MGEGVVAPGHLLVGPRAAGVNPSVDVAPGACWVLGDDAPDRQPIYRCRSDSIVNLAAPIDPALPTLHRVVARVYDAAFAGAQRRWALELLAGVPTTGATYPANPLGLPALPNGAAPLAVVRAPAGASGITAGDVFSTLDAERPRARVGRGGALGPVMFEIADVLLDTPTATFDFQNIPQIFRHLKLVLQTRDSIVAATNTLSFNLNGDATGSYDWNYFDFVGAAVSGSQGQGQTTGVLGGQPGANAGAGAFGQIEVMFANYRSAVAHKTWVAVGGFVWGTLAGELGLRIAQGRYRKTDPITRIATVNGGGASNLVAGSRATLYGLL